MIKSEATKHFRKIKSTTGVVNFQFIQINKWDD